MKKLFYTVLFLSIITSCTSTGTLGSRKAEKISAELIQVHKAGDSRYFSISPDGMYAAVNTGEGISIISLSDNSVLMSTEAVMRSIDFDSFSWAPDSSKAVFTENYFFYFHESDLWVMNLETGTTKHLADDGIDNIFDISSDQTTYIEMQPVWSPDSKSILTTRVAADTLVNYFGIIKDLDIGTINEEFFFCDDSPFASTSGAFWRKDYIYFTQEFNKSDNSKEGIYRIKKDGTGKERLIAYYEEGDEIILLEMSNDEKYGLAVYLKHQKLITGAPTYESYYRLIDMNELLDNPLKKAKDNGMPFSLHAAVFSPSGNKIAYIYDPAKPGTNNTLPGTAEKSSVIVIRDADSKTENIVYTGSGEYSFINSTLRVKQNLFWTENDKLFIIADKGKTLLEFKLR